MNTSPAATYSDWTIPESNSCLQWL